MDRQVKAFIDERSLLTPCVILDRVLFCGSRTWSDANMIYKVMNDRIFDFIKNSKSNRSFRTWITRDIAS